ncbi:BatD family protein [Bradyrhizobium stylosanthis]|nr:BatD family protein [Bradyrhizobium stylosanthis]
MMRPIMLCALAATVALPTFRASAQQAGPPEPIVRAGIDPPRVVVGQPTTLRIEVLAPNYLTSPPAMPSFQISNAATRQLRSVNINEQHDGATYAGVRFEYAIYPQEAGLYALPEQSVGIKYAAEPPAVRDVSVPLPRLPFEAYVPDAAAAMRPFLSARKLTAEQSVKRSSDKLKPGDAVTRTVRVDAEGTQAMLLPPQTFAAVDGLRLYPAQPVLNDTTDGRADVTTSTRTDSAIYMLERNGSYALPEIVIAWWNTESARIEQIRLEAMPLEVEGGPTAGGLPSGAWTWEAVRDAVIDHWALVSLLFIGIIGLAWGAPAAARRLMRIFQRRHAAYLNSEAWSFRHLRRAAGKRDAADVYFGLLAWLQRFEPVAKVGTIDALTSAAQDPLLDQQIAALRAELFAPQRTSAGWSPRKLIGRLRSARRRLRRRSHRHGLPRVLPDRINPMGEPTARFSNRRVAR